MTSENALAKHQLPNNYEFYVPIEPVTFNVAASLVQKLDHKHNTDTITFCKLSLHSIQLKPQNFTVARTESLQNLQGLFLVLNAASSYIRSFTLATLEGTLAPRIWS